MVVARSAKAGLGLSSRWPPSPRGPRQPSRAAGRGAGLRSCSTLTTGSPSGAAPEADRFASCRPSTRRRPTWRGPTRFFRGCTGCSRIHHQPTRVDHVHDDRARRGDPEGHGPVLLVDVPVRRHTRRRCAPPPERSPRCRSAPMQELAAFPGRAIANCITLASYEARLRSQDEPGHRHARRRVPARAAHTSAGSGFAAAFPSVPPRPACPPTPSASTMERTIALVINPAVERLAAFVDRAVPRERARRRRALRMFRAATGLQFLMRRNTSRLSLPSARAVRQIGLSEV